MKIINYNLEKLHEHLSILQNSNSLCIELITLAFNKDLMKDMHYFTSISIYIKEALSQYFVYLKITKNFLFAH